MDNRELYTEQAKVNLLPIYPFESYEFLFNVRAMTEERQNEPKTDIVFSKE